MLIDDTQEEYCVWDKVFEIFKFNPSVKDQDGHSITGKLPFQINSPYSVYAIEPMTEKQINLMNNQIRNSFIVRIGLAA